MKAGTLKNRHQFTRHYWRYVKILGIRFRFCYACGAIERDWTKGWERLPDDSPLRASLIEGIASALAKR